MVQKYVLTFSIDKVWVFVTLYAVIVIKEMVYMLFSVDCVLLYFFYDCNVCVFGNAKMFSAWTRWKDQFLTMSIDQRSHLQICPHCYSMAE